jgi:prephenate dehydrogenase
MKTVAIAGVGLIGGSFGLALRAAGFAGEILGVSSEKAIAAGMARGAISAGATIFSTWRSRWIAFSTHSSFSMESRDRSA